MHESRAARYDGLQELDFHGLSAFCSHDTLPSALLLARRCTAAQGVLRRLFGYPVVPELLILNRADWPTRAAIATYGLTHYDRSRHAIVAPGEPSDVLAPVLALLARAAPEQLPRLHALYGGEVARPDLSAHVDTWVAHDLGHAYHLDRGAWFPRRWLMELFADLCAYSALAAAEPAALPALMGLPRALATIGPEAVPFADLATFEVSYGAWERNLAMYLWYHGRLFLLAERLHATQGEMALQRLWTVFVLPQVVQVDEAALAALLASVDPLLADAVGAWPTLPGAS